jgi:integrase
VAGCKNTSRKQRNCRCPIWAEGTIHDEKIRRSLDLSNWEAAVRLVREWEINKPSSTLTVGEAFGKFLKDAEARKLRGSSLLKYKQAEKALEPIAKKLLRQVTVNDVRQFCVESAWLEVNPALSVKGPKVSQVPTIPFSDDEAKDIFAALEEKYLDSHPMSTEGTKKRIKAFILVMLHGGIRISDCVFLKRQRIEDGRLFLRSAKTGVPVRVPLPDECLKALDDCRMDGDFYFSTGRGKAKTWTTEWEERLKKVFVLAGLPEGHSHRLRDTFSVRLLSHGVPIEAVAALLGNTVKVVERHYNPWVKVRQESLEASVRATW